MFILFCHAAETMLTPEQTEIFDAKGYLHVPAVMDSTQAAELETFVWSCLAKLHGIARDRPETWEVEGPWLGMKNYKDAEVLHCIGSDKLCQCIDDFLGMGNWKRPRNWGGFLIDFPKSPPESWQIPTDHWHVDAHFTYEPTTLFGLRVFTFLSDIQPRGGGTLVASGSHHLVTRFVSQLTGEQRALGFAKLRDRFLSNDPWFQRLTNAEDQHSDRSGFFMEQDRVVDSVRLRLEQLCGRAGDVVLMHPWLVHGKSPHCGTKPRFTLAKDIFAISAQPKPETAASVD